MSDPTPTAPAVKPGYATTEGWLTFIVALCGVAPTTLGTGAPQLVQMVGLIGAILTTIAYQYHRTQVKTGGTPIAGQLLELAAPVAPEQPKGFARLGVMLAIAGIGFALYACGPKTKLAEQQYIDCLEQRVKEEVPSLVPTVTAILSSGVSDWQAQLEALAAYAGKDALACAVQAAEQSFLAKSGATASPDAAQKAADFIKAHGWTYRP